VQTIVLENITSISAGSLYNIVLKNDGTVWAWGANFTGQLGDGTVRPSYIPVQTLDINNIVSVSAGSYQSVALKNDGTVWAWGEYGGVFLPFKIEGLENIIKISTNGTNGLLELKNDGTVWKY